MTISDPVVKQLNKHLNRLPIPVQMHRVSKERETKRAWWAAARRRRKMLSG